MIRQFELVELVKEYNPNTDEDLLKRAYVFGAIAHARQVRASGEPYFGHPLEVAAIVTQLKLDDPTIVTALLHDTVEDTSATHDEIKRRFGAEIAQLVDGVTKLTQLELSSVETAQAENFRKLLLAISKDVRVLLVKLADRLHNMRTITHLKQEKRVRIAHDTMEIFAPLAGRMGMQKMREELEDLAFGVLNPDARTSIMRRFVTLKKSTGDVIPVITREIEQALDKHDVPSTVRGREKRPFSIWRKMEKQQVSFEQLSDIIGFRIIVGSETDCYRALGAIHRKWRVVPGRFKDYISGPKANGYHSLHTTVIGPKGMRVEMQIRTEAMDEIAESGIAAHWSYKNGERVRNPFAVDPFHWLRDLVERLESNDAPQDFLEHAKLEMFHDQVFCFTPKGDVIGLPRGATPIDFAYAIHTKVGDSCVGVKINGQRMPLSTRLRNGQSVEIIRSEAQRPSPVWEEMAFTGKAKAAIRRSLRELANEEYARLGQQIARHAFSRRGKECTDKTLETAAKRLDFNAAEDMLAALGRAEITGVQVVGAVYPLQRASTLSAALGQSGPETSGAQIKGLRRGIVTRFSPCCQPIPGERIVGIVGEGGGVDIHAIDCTRLADFEEVMDRWLDVRWSDDAADRAAHVTCIALTLANEPGALGKVCALIAERRANIDNIAVTERKPDFFNMQVDLEVRDVKHLSNILTILGAQSIVAEARRSATIDHLKAGN